jgi:succinate dehydrogenase/fumarate reductase cytochrome b subunit
LTPVKSRIGTVAARKIQMAGARQAQQSPTPQFKKSSPLLMTYRVILWIALAAYPIVLQGMHAASEISNPVAVRALGFLGLAATCLPVAMALLCLHELPKINLPERVRRTIGREAVLGAVSASLFIVVNNSLNLMKLLPLRDRTWWVLIALIFLMKFLPVRTSVFSSEIRTRRIHIGAASVVLLYALEHIANHLVALYSFEASDAMMTAFRHFLRIPPIEILLLTAVAVQIISGVRLVSGSRMLQRGTFLRNLQILSGAYLAVFIFAHVVNVVLVDRILHDGNTMFSGFTGKGAYGMLTSLNNSRLMPYYVISVAAVFVHVGAAGRWLLIPKFGSAGTQKNSPPPQCGSVSPPPSPLPCP